MEWRDKLLELVKKYRIALPTLNKEVLVDGELLEEAFSYLVGDVTVPFAFPGFVFSSKKGLGLDTDNRRVEAIKEEYGVLAEIWEPPKFGLFGESIYLEPDYRYARDVLGESLTLLPKRIVSITRESVLLSLIAEPGWKEYGPITVLANLFYEVEDAFRVGSESFFPRGKSSMGMAYIKLVKPYAEAEGFYSFLKRIFTNRKKKIKLGSLKTGKRVDKMYPDELLELYETTVRG